MRKRQAMTSARTTPITPKTPKTRQSAARLAAAKAALRSGHLPTAGLSDSFDAGHPPPIDRVHTRDLLQHKTHRVAIRAIAAMPNVELG